MDTFTQEDIDHLNYRIDETVTSWLGTAGSQIFFMQLGFLCYEVGFVANVWAPSIILKNIEDTFVGILTYLCFTHTLSTSSPSLYGLISIPNQPFLIDVDAADHAGVFVAAVFATTCATIISGAVLERMKNKAYIVWCFMVILINYSFMSHWIWNVDGWLAKLGYMDGAGAVVVHSTGGVAGAVAAWRLGPRRGALDKHGVLKPVETAHRPIINAIGAFILWYGWFAFNISSPIVADLGIGAAVGTTGLVTCISPTCASCAALLLMYWDFATLSYDNLLGAMLAGLVGITGGCFTVNVWESAVIGFFAAPVYFLTSWITRYKLHLDDPLQIIPIHLCCGLYSCIIEGVFANNVNNHPGLVYAGYEHLGIQILGTLACFVFNVIVCLFLWLVIMEKCLFRNTSIKVSILDTYLGVSLFELNNNMALEEVLANKSNLARQMSFRFHKYTVERFNNDQYDFLIAVQIFRDLMQYEKQNPTKIARAIISIIDTYILPDAIMCVNLSGTQRARLIKIKNQLQFELAQLELRQKRKERANNGANGINLDNIEIDAIPALVDDHSMSLNDRNIETINRRRSRISSKRSSSLLNEDLMSETIFDSAGFEVFKIVLPVFTQFLHKFSKKRDTIKDNVRLPFALQDDWTLKWDEEFIKEYDAKNRSLSKAAARSIALHDNDHLQKVNSTRKHRATSESEPFGNNKHRITKSQELELVNPTMLTHPITNGDQQKSPVSTSGSPAFILHAPFEKSCNDNHEQKGKEDEQEQNEDGNSATKQLEPTSPDSGGSRSSMELITNNDLRVKEENKETKKQENGDTSNKVTIVISDGL